MPYIAQTVDLTSQYLQFYRSEDTFRPLPATTFVPGTAVKFVPLNSQVYPDQKTVTLTGTGAGQQLIVGVVSDTWNGFNGSIGSPSYLSPASANPVRGTQGVDVIVAGYHPAVYVDQSGTGATAITNGTTLIASRATAGYAQGATSAVSAYGGIGTAMLPSSGVGSVSITAAALTQASQTDTLTGTPAAGDTLSVTIQTPYTMSAPGVLQTTTWTTPALTSGQAATVTTAAAALVAYLNAQTSFSQFFIASNSSGVVTVTVNALANPFLVTYSNGIDGQAMAGFFNISLSGTVANTLTFAVASTGGTVSTAGAATLASGAGFLGTLPALVA